MRRKECVGFGAFLAPLCFLCLFAQGALGSGRNPCFTPWLYSALPPCVTVTTGSVPVVALKVPQLGLAAAGGLALRLWASCQHPLVLIACILGDLATAPQLLGPLGSMLWHLPGPGSLFVMFLP